LTSLTDSTHVDKVNFIRAYAKAREVGMTKKNILSGWRVTGNWLISRAKALRHLEIQDDKKEASLEPIPYLGSDDIPKTSRQICDLGKNKTPVTQRRYVVIAKGFEAQEQTLVAHAVKIASLEEEVARLKRGKKRKAIPNPNRHFMTLSEALAAGEAIPKVRSQVEHIVVDSDSDLEVVSEVETALVIEAAPETPHLTTRLGRLIKKPRKM